MKYSEAKVGQKINYIVSSSGHEKSSKTNETDQLIPATVLAIGNDENGSFKDYVLLGWKDKPLTTKISIWNIWNTADENNSIIGFYFAEKIPSILKDFKYARWVPKDYDLFPVKTSSSFSSFGLPSLIALASLTILNKKVSQNDYEIDRREGRAKD
jgi:hypothetical protein